LKYYLRTATLLAALLETGAAATLAAQSALPLNDPGIRRAFESIQKGNAWTLEQQVQLCEIPAPPFKETARGVEVRKRLIALGYPSTRVDGVGNVIVERPGTGSGPTVLISGHLDTVFPEGTDVKVRREGTRYHGPGIADDCRGLAVLLTIAKTLNEQKIQTAGKVILVADVGEDGNGNLRGLRNLFEKEYEGSIDCFISVDGAGTSITSRAVATHRYRLIFTGPGGHSYSAFGTPSAIHAMGRAIANISELKVPTEPKTTFNVGIVSGGTSVNTISANGTMEVDMRSESVTSLNALDKAMRAAVARAVTAENARWPKSGKKISVHFDTMGIRPVGKVPQTDKTPIVKLALDAGKAVGLDVSTTATSGDSNLPMSLGIPSITIEGGGEAAGMHSLTEWYDDGPAGYKGSQWALLILTALAGLSKSTTP